MARKICRRTGKVGYRSVSEAAATLREIEANAHNDIARFYETSHREVSVYKCLFCPRWHLTSQRQREGTKGVNLRE